MMQVETLVEKTDRMLTAMGAVAPTLGSGPLRDMASLWRSGLGGSLLFTVDDPTADPSAEKEAKIIISGYLERVHDEGTAISTSGLVDFQHQLQIRSKVISAIEMLLRG